MTTGTGAATRRGGGWRGLLGGIVVGLGLAGVIAAALGPVALNHKTTLPFEAEIARVVKNAGVPGDVQGRKNPVADDAAAITEGRRLYSISCAACHGPGGQGNGAVGRNLYPPPANLLSPESRALTDGQMFWFINNGISFAGMPSYGVNVGSATATYNETQIWQLIAQIRSLQAGNNLPGNQPPVASPSPSPSPASGAGR